MRNTFIACLTLLAALLVSAGTVRAEERILNYHSDIAIATDGSMEVTEQITVVAEGDQIRHGIYRDFPTDYRDPQYNRVHIDFEVLGASRDGEVEDWHSERRDNGMRVYVGSKDTTVTPGKHKFTIRYRVNRELGFFADHDELYWNVTGTGWGFPIAKASARVHLPQKVPANKLTASGYSGDKNSTAQDVATTVLDDGAEFVTTHPLGPHQNLSIVLEFPKGIVTEPSATQEFIWLLQDNRNLLLALAGLILLWIYYLIAWNRHGRDPDSGPLVAQYEPPDGDSAAALRYVSRMGYDNTCLSAGVIDLAAHGQLSIEQDEDDVYTLVKLESADGGALQVDNRKLLDSLFASGERLQLKQDNHKELQAAQLNQQTALSRAYEKRYFFTNTGKMWPGLLISLVTLAAMLWGKPLEHWFMLVWIGGWTLGTLGLLRNALAKRSTGAWILAIVFSIIELGALAFFGSMVGYHTMVALLVLFSTNFAFYHWMKAPTQLGAKLLDRVRGFRWYLGVAEKQELDSRYTPQSNPELFARYLPYAVALDVGNAWAERFASALSPAQMREAQPTWYHGAGMSTFTAASFTSMSSSLSSGVSSAIASSSTAPGSSSGGGGGGSSGGGGGGGGGGGW